MEILVIVVGFIALFVALNARKAVTALQFQLNSLLKIIRLAGLIR